MSMLFLGFIIFLIAVISSKAHESSQANRKQQGSYYNQNQNTQNSRYYRQQPQQPMNQPQNFQGQQNRTVQHFAPPAPQPQTVQSPAADPEVARIIEHSRNYITKIKIANDKIPDEDMSDLISRIESVTKDIFDAVVDKPENIPSLRRFLSYYLPTTLKLMETYAHLDKRMTQTSNITATKHEIKAMLEKLLEAYYKLLDSIYDSTAMDVMNEISAMESILSSEGLLKGENDISIMLDREMQG